MTGAGPTSRSVETERKYAVDATTPLPDLTPLDVVDDVATHDPEELVAVCFDTAGLDLVGRGITLRRRVGGADEGWHLKQPGEPDTKTETRLPLGRAVRTVPKALREEVASLTDGRPLVAVAEIRTVRVERHLSGPDGEPLAVLCDDHVHARRLLEPALTQQWREWEVELTGAPPELLDAVERLLLESGATPAGPSSKVARALVEELPPVSVPEDVTGRSTAAAVLGGYLAEHLAVLQEHDAGLRGESVHRLRIAARRLRSALATYRPVLEKGAAEALREELRWLGTELADARDAEVLLAHLDRLVDDEPEGSWREPLRRRVRDDLAEQHRRGREAAVQAVDSDRFRHLLRAVTALAQAPALRERGIDTAANVLPHLLARDARRLRRTMDAAKGLSPGPERDRALHVVRKKAKRLRYAAESAAPALGSRADRLRKRARAVQRALGEHQDSVVGRAWLESLSERADDPAVAFGAGRLHAHEERRADRAVDDYGMARRRVRVRHVARWVRH